MILKRFLSNLKDNKKVISINKSNLLKYENSWPTNDEILKIEEKKEQLVPLVNHLRSIIKTRGPLSVHDYMAQALNNIEYGYYQQNSIKIGSKGDFITSPEISSIFCELIGVWCVASWEAMGSPPKLNLVELGPGKGTLMKEILKVSQNFPYFKKAISVHMVEVSEVMRNIQRKALLPELSENNIDYSAISSTSPPVDTSKGVAFNGVPIHWHNLLREVPSTQSVYLGHEILDAFPVHQFAKLDGKWRELLVDVDFTENSKYHFRFVRSSIITPGLNVFFNKNRTEVSLRPLTKLFDPVESPIPTTSTTTSTIPTTTTITTIIQTPTPTPTIPISMSSTKQTIPPLNSSSKTQELILTDKPQKISSTTKDEEEKTVIDHALYDPKLDSLEVSPLAFALIEEISRRVLKEKSVSLLVDYGENYPQGDTLRGFKEHKAAHVLSEPGQVDISADVNFKACAQIAKEIGASVQGPITQKEFLGKMGIVERLESIVEKENFTEEELDRLFSSTEKVATGLMGEKFKFISIVHPSITTPGF